MPCMTFILQVLAVAIAAFYVWMAVRIVNRRERWAKWTLTMTSVVSIRYPLSIGPAGWLLNRDSTPVMIELGARAFYMPLRLIVRNSPGPVQKGADLYCDLWIREPRWGVTDWDAN